MKRRDALKGLSLLGLFSTLGTQEAAAEITAPTAPEVPDALRQLFEGMQMVARVQKLPPSAQQRLIADLRAKGEHGAADWTARVSNTGA